MAIVILVRHGRTAANAEGILAGWTPGVHLDETGQGQAQKVADRLRPTPLAAVVTSPLERCRQTAQAIVAGQDGPAPPLRIDEQIGECHYGAWTGRKLRELTQDALWRDVQERPGSVTFPAHADFRAESLQAMVRRAVEAIAGWDARIEEEHGPGAVWAAVSHGDVIKALVSDAVGGSLDTFQRVVIDPASLSIVHHARRHPFVLRVNDTNSDVVDLRALSQRLTEAGPGGAGEDAAVGGGAGSD